ncbi:fb9c511d-125a-416a-99e0-912d3ab13f02 [Sclerotinia trifoliorum]|uniref:Fb9c511d-125a-416a-99e0-912d3ab13f02 n=1 Tax=Sclerotinia trifoliorum TaxID=28548 RepID=A0A8H2VNK5_9HELO|nr:fb9c511d-125a-416a-99e0-912d3ab13f02 [Sclerotinia trifoliorum]
MELPTRSVLMTPEVLDEIVTLYVGSKRKKYIVHKRILCDQSEFFDAGFNGGFKEATEGKMYLPEDDPIAVADLIEYLYRGSLPRCREDGGSEKVRNLYYLAEKIGLLSLMDKLMDLLAVPRIQQTGHLVGYGSNAIKEIYDHTHEGSKLRLFVTAVNVFRLRDRGNEKDWMSDRAKLLHSNPEFFHDVFKLVGKHGKKVWVEKSEGKAFVTAFEQCYFHVHGPDKECYANLETGKEILE